MAKGKRQNPLCPSPFAFRLFPMQTILVVDDEKNIRLLYKAELEDEGYKVLTASNGLEALDVLKKETVDLVLLDIKMPEMSGSEFLRYIRQFNQTLPIIISTAYGDQVSQDFSAWLSDDYALKTADLTEIKTKIKETLAD
jgi:CheY-like chemotaxis protein